MRILLLTLQFPPDVNSTGLLMARLGQGLTARGHHVSVVTTFPHYAQFRVWDEYRGRLAARGQFQGMNVLRLYVHARGRKQNMLNRLLSYVSFNVLALCALLVDRQRYDVILCQNGGFFSGLTAAVVGRIKAIPVVCNIQDLYPDTPVSTGQLRSPLAIKGLQLLERLTYRAVDRLTVITPSFAANLLRKGVPADKVAVIPNFVDTSFIRPVAKRNPFSLREGLADRFLVTHAGNIGYVYDLETLLDAAALLRDDHEVLILIVGDGVAKARLQQQAQQRGLTNVRFLPFQPMEDLPWLRGASDVQVSLYKKGSAQHSMPSKIYEVMASGRPLLASAEQGSDIRRLVDDTGCGVCVDPEDAGQLAVAVRALLRDPARRAEMGRRGREQAEAHYVLPTLVAQYEAVLSGVAGRRDALVAGGRGAHIG